MQVQAGGASPGLEGEARYRRLVEMSPDPIAVHGDGRVLYVNGAALRALGATSAEQVVGRPITDFLGPELQGIVPDRIAEMLRTGQPAPVIRGEFRRLDGSALIGDIASMPTMFDGRPAVQVVIRDTTEQTAAEAELRRREQEFKALVEDAPDVIARFDAGHRITYINPAIEHYTGRRPAEVIGRQLGRTFSPELTARWEAVLARTIETGRVESFEFEMSTPHGPTVFQCRLTPQRAAEGRIESVLVVGRDITELRRTELALRRSEATLRAVLNGAAIGITQVSTDGRFVGTNPAFAEMLGYGMDEVVRLHFRDVTHPDDLAATQAMHDRTLSTGEHQQVEKRYLRRDGSTFWARLTTSLVTMADGPSYVVGMVEDITARKAAEEALRESEARFRSLIEHSADLIAILDPQGRTLYQSPSIRDMLGYDPAKVLGSDVLDLIHPDDAPGIRADLAALCAAPPGSVTSAEFRMRHADGSWRALRSTAENRLDDPAVRGIVVNTRDLTVARELEAQLFQSQKMQAVGRLAGGMAHDFNNILTAVQGHAGMLAQELPPGSPHLPDVEQIQRSVERAASLTRQLLAFSRLQVLQPKVIDLNAIVMETERMLRRLIGEDIELRTELMPLLGRINADPAQVQQILLNLAVNARDAMPEGGRVVIRTENVELDEGFTSGFAYPVSPGRYVLLSFSDTGCGMAPELVEHIFEPFFTTKEAGHGTGLGLSSVYGIVKQSGGYVWVDTAPGQGTTFRIYLPEVAEQVDVAEERPISVGQGSGVILLVEDEPEVRSLSLRVLSRAGYTVLPATDGEDALRLCREYDGAIDLVLTDVVMPRLGGGELAARVVALRPGTRVLFMSGYARDALAQRGVAQGAGFLAKPFSPDVLRRSVAEALTAPPPGG